MDLVAKDALFAGKGRTQDIGQLMRLAATSTQYGYRTTTIDIYQTAIAASHDFHQLNAIAQTATAAGYNDQARVARLKAISLAGH